MKPSLESAPGLTFSRTDEVTYAFSDPSGNEYTVYFLESWGRPGHYEVEYLTQARDYREMTGGNIPFTVSNTVFGDILSDFSATTGFEQVRVAPLDERRMSLYMRTLSQRFPPPAWRVGVAPDGDITVEREKLGTPR